MIRDQIDQAVQTLKTGGIIAYPTEAVFGLGCDPFNEAAVHKLLRIKQRSIEKGLILIAADWEQIQSLVDLDAIDPVRLDQLKQSFPSAITWLFPASDHVPAWISGEHQGQGQDRYKHQYRRVALRVTGHPIARKLCQGFGGAIVSTSANLSHASPTRDMPSTLGQFGGQVDFVVSGEVGELLQPTAIIDVLTGARVR